MTKNKSISTFWYGYLYNFIPVSILNKNLNNI